METPLNAREFLKRFHLPQLVRISTTSSPAAEDSASSRRVSTISNCQPINGEQQHERSNDWTYKPAAETSPSFRSLVNCNEIESNSAGRQFHSISDWTSAAQQVMPRASLSNQPPHVTRRTKEVASSEHHEEERRPRGESIRLMPPSKRPAQCKLELEQPFLLYKAYKKLELCAYSIDPNNELNDKSGDPIYFPQNYPGWFSLDGQQQNGRGKQQHQQQPPLESIDQVCRMGFAQIFITRDELIAYQLPAKLSHLTKLKNNQLLALPLAISLADSMTSGGSGSSSSSNKHHGGSQRGAGNKENNNTGSASMSDLKRVIIQSGQVLKICGIYEDVMPLIEGNQQLKSSFHQQQHARHPHGGGGNHKQKQQQPQMPLLLQHPNQHQQQRQVMQLDPHCSIPCQQMAPPFGQQQQQQQQLYGCNGYKNKTKQKPKCATVRGCKIVGQYPIAAEAIYTGPPQPAPPPLRPTGQRYARCVVLSQSSIDRMVTNSRLVESNCNSSSGSSFLEPDLPEVLIPIEQPGRFYLCASSGTDLLGAASSQEVRSRLVFRLSQVISLLSLSRKLRVSCEAVDCRRPLSGPSGGAQLLALPLIADLVIGPRPANFSPSMFGSSSSMESYFSQERNVGGHSIGCRYHKLSPDVPPSPHEAHHQHQMRPNEAACVCAQRVSNWMTNNEDQSIGLMSGMVRIERIAKRDVLLACTIKLNPLEHLDLQQMNLSPTCGKDGISTRKTLNHLSASERDQLANNNCVSGRLMALRESKNGTSSSSSNQQEQQQQQQELTSRLFGKSSFSRLRACRSLISLHGRRKKRPNIPISMLTATASNQQPIPFPAAAAVDPLAPAGEQHAATRKSKPAPLRLDLPPTKEQQATQHQRQQQQLCLQDGGELIVMVEFDCNDSELRFVRTFVDSSLPTSSIPDLVLNRIEHCNKNSFDWERQLKLSHRTLSHDFDCYKQQLIAIEQQQQQQQQQQQHHQQQQRLVQRQTSSSLACMYERENSAGQQQQKQTRQTTMLLHSRRPGDDDDDDFREQVKLRRQQLRTTKAKAAAAAADVGVDGSATCADDSTASSRSSSGVSSAGDRNRGRTHASGAHGKSNSLIILNQQQHQQQQHLHSSSASSSTTGGRDHAASLTSSSVASCATSLSASLSAVANQPVASTNGSSQSSSSSSSSSSTQQQQQGRLLRLVNKILPGRAPSIAAGHKMPAEQRPRVKINIGSDSRDQQQPHRTTLMNSQKIHRRLLSARGVGESHDQPHHCPPIQANNTNSNHDDDDDEDDGSHLYESLERINEQMQQQQQQQQSNLLPKSRHRRLLDGATMDCHLRRPNRSDTEEEDDDDDDDWWADGSSSSEHSTMKNDRDRWETLDGGAFKGRSRLRAKHRAGLLHGEPSSTGMEPVSIEAVEEVLVNDSSSSSSVESSSSIGSIHDDDDDDDDDDDNEGNEYAGGGSHRRSGSNPVLVDKQEEQHYVNLQQSKSSFELEAVAAKRQPQQQPITRMERKLLKIRSRRSFVVSQITHVESQHQQQQQAPVVENTHTDHKGQFADGHNLSVGGGGGGISSSDDSAWLKQQQQQQHHMHRARPALGRNNRRSKPSPPAAMATPVRGSAAMARSLSSPSTATSPAASTEAADGDNDRGKQSVNSLLWFSDKAKVVDDDRLASESRDGAQHEADLSSGGDQVDVSDGAINSLHSRSNSSESCSSFTASDDHERPATENSSRYSSSPFGEGGSSSSSCKSSTTNWSSLSTMDNKRPFADHQEQARVGQVTDPLAAEAAAATTTTTMESKTSLAAAIERPTCRARQ